MFSADRRTAATLSFSAQAGPLATAPVSGLAAAIHDCRDHELGFHLAVDQNAREPVEHEPALVADLVEHLPGLRIALDVVEHFEDHDAFVEKLKARLRPGGTAAIKVPAQASLYGAMDKASGHWRRYDAADLQALFERHGFRTRALRPMNPVGAWGYRLKKDRQTNYSKTFSPTKLKLVNAAIPVLSLFDLVPGLDGLSLVGVFDLPS